MYSVAVKRDFIAQHFLIGGDWGAENQLHSHHYVMELELEGEDLNEHGYLVDIVAIEHHLEEVRDLFADQTLNDIGWFEGLNPSIEHFARILCEALTNRISEPNISSFTVRLWENEIAWASYRMTVS